MARRLERSLLLRWGPGLLWWLRLRWLLCAAIGPDAVGASLAAGESLLLICLINPSVKSPGPCGRGFLLVQLVELDPPVSSNPAEKMCNRPQAGNNFCAGDLVRSQLETEREAEPS